MEMLRYAQQKFFWRWRELGRRIGRTPEEDAEFAKLDRRFNDAYKAAKGSGDDEAARALLGRWKAEDTPPSPTQPPIEPPKRRGRGRPPKK